MELQFRMFAVERIIFRRLVMRVRFRNILCEIAKQTLNPMDPNPECVHSIPFWLCIAMCLHFHFVIPFSHLNCCENVRLLCARRWSKSNGFGMFRQNTCHWEVKFVPKDSLLRFGNSLLLLTVTFPPLFHFDHALRWYLHSLRSRTGWNATLRHF